MVNELKFGIVGCGRIAARHAQHIKSIGELVAVCDIVPEKTDLLVKEYGSRSYTDLSKMLSSGKDIDVVSVCSPNGLHAEHSIAALKAGFHVVCEKPMALTIHDCGDMIKAAEHANKRLFIVKQNRFNPPVFAVKQALDEGRFGKIYSVQLNCFWNRNTAYYKDSWKGTKALDGGTLFTQFSHFIDLLYWMFGDVDAAAAYLSNYHHKGEIEFEDSGVVNLKFSNGIMGNINYSVNAFAKNMEGSLVILGEKGTVKIGGQYLNELEYQNIEGFEIRDLPKGNPANQYGTYVGSMSNHDKVYENVREVLLNGGIIATHGFEGLKTVDIIGKIYSNAEWI